MMTTCSVVVTSSTGCYDTIQRKVPLIEIMAVHLPMSPDPPAGEFLSVRFLLKLAPSVASKSQALLHRECAAINNNPWILKRHSNRTWHWSTDLSLALHEGPAGTRCSLASSAAPGSFSLAARNLHLLWPSACRWSAHSNIAKDDKTALAILSAAAVARCGKNPALEHDGRNESIFD